MEYTGISAMSDFWKVVREFNPESVEREATAPLDLVVVGSTDSNKEQLVSSLLGDGHTGWSTEPFRLMDLDVCSGESLNLAKPDLVILVIKMEPKLDQTGETVAKALRGTRAPILLVFSEDGLGATSRDLRNSAYRAFSFVSYLRTAFLYVSDGDEVRAKLIPMILEAIPQLRTAIARQLPNARPIVADQVIAETCKVNAQFALAASIPSNIPFVGGIAGSVADFFVLTKNQVMMVFRLAAIYGRDIAPTGQVAAEIAPVIGAAFLWRSAARFAIGLLPSIVSAAPKMAIAYVGTYVAGHAASYYYQEGRKPTREMLNRFARQGSKLFKRQAHPKALPAPNDDEQPQA